MCERKRRLSYESHGSIEEHASSDNAHATKVKTKHWSSVGRLVGRSGGGRGARSARAGRDGSGWLRRSLSSQALRWQRIVHGADSGADCGRSDGRRWDARNVTRGSRSRGLRWRHVDRRCRESWWRQNWRSSLAAIHGDGNGRGDGRARLVWWEGE